MMETEIRTMDFEDGGRGHKPRNAGSHQKLKKGRRWIIPLGPPEGTSLADTSTLALKAHFRRLTPRNVRE